MARKRNQIYRHCLDCKEHYFLNIALNEELPKLYDKCPSCGSTKTEWAKTVMDLLDEISVKLAIIDTCANAITHHPDSSLQSEGLALTETRNDLEELVQELGKFAKKVG